MKRIPKAFPMNGYGESPITTSPFFSTNTSSKQPGLTETSAGIVTNVLQDYARHPDSIGVVTATHEARIMSEDGTRELPRGQIGEMAFRGPQIIKSYWNNPDVCLGDGDFTWPL
jgi:acyl-CoA synthetase (AMP-forming)/AMP-acid ligase II